jgi:hypothetical protein
MVGQGEPSPPMNLKQRSLERPKQKLPERLDWSMKPTKRLGKDTAVGRMTRGCWGMKLRMVLPPGAQPQVQPASPSGA